MESIESRFWSKVDVRGPGECWLWTASRLPRGYGTFQLAGKCRRAHRVAYELAKGPIAQGLHVLHTCDVTSCCNPAHLHLGTHADNMREMVERSRARTGKPRQLTMQQAREVRALAGKRSFGELGRMYGSHAASIRKIIRGEIYREEQEVRARKTAPGAANQPGGHEPAA